MHAECAAFVLESAENLEPGRVLEFGGLNVNGHVRYTVPSTSWHCVDIEPGSGVDEVADASIWRGEPNSFDTGLCLEVGEHTDKWPLIVANMWYHLKPGGVFIFTAACEPRPIHGAYGDHGLAEGEYYQNVDVEVAEVIFRAFFSYHFKRVLPRGDLQIMAWK